MSESETPRKPSLEWKEEMQTFVVLPGMCPYPIDNDDGTIEDCVRHGHCGCDLREKTRMSDLTEEEVAELVELGARAMRKRWLEDSPAEWADLSRACLEAILLKLLAERAKKEEVVLHAIRNVDGGDLTWLQGALGDGGHGKFWKAVAKDWHAALLAAARAAHTKEKTES